MTTEALGNLGNLGIGHELGQLGQPVRGKETLRPQLASPCLQIRWWGDGADREGSSFVPPVSDTGGVYYPHLIHKYEEEDPGPREGGTMMTVRKFRLLNGSAGGQSMR